MGKDVQPLQSVKTSILAKLTVRSGLGDIYIKGDDSCVLNMLIVYCLMLYIIYVTLIMRFVGAIQSSCYACGVRHGLTIAIFPKPQEKFRLVINQSIGSCRVELIPEVGDYLSDVCCQRLSLLYYVHYIFMHCLLILPFICSYV